MSLVQVQDQAGNGPHIGAIAQFQRGALQRLQDLTPGQSPRRGWTARTRPVFQVGSLVAGQIAMHQAVNGPAVQSDRLRHSSKALPLGDQQNCLDAAKHLHLLGSPQSTQ